MFSTLICASGPALGGVVSCGGCNRFHLKFRPKNRGLRRPFRLGFRALRTDWTKLPSSDTPVSQTLSVPLGHQFGKVGLLGLDQAGGEIGHVTINRQIRREQIIHQGLKG